MLSDAEQAAVKAIELQLEPIIQEETELTAKLSALKQSKARLEAALKALQASWAGKGAKSAKPCARKETVMEVCLAIVRDNAPISKADLEALAKDKISNDLGMSLSGVKLRLRECLASDAFILADDDTITLTKGPPSKGAA